MDVLVFHPVLGMGAVDETYRYTQADKIPPDKYRGLLATGNVISDVTVWDNYVFYGEQKIVFWLITNDKIPEGLPFTTETVSEGFYKCKTWSHILIDKLRKAHPTWKISEIEPIVQKERVLPRECQGETWAITEETVAPSRVPDDCYCIEHNWEQRGDYWIVDCISRNKRLVHSDTLGVNEEYDIG